MNIVIHHLLVHRNMHFYQGVESESQVYVSSS